jgi:4-hydroxythreonine-4-phosphate dehydrogenase
MPSVSLPPLALTAGEPAGIAAEITLKAWLERRSLPVPFYTVTDADHLRETAARLGLPVSVELITDPQQTRAVFPQALPVLHQPLAVPVTPGVLDPANAPAVLASLHIALKSVKNNTASGLVTNPIHKGTLYAAGFSYDGHTEYLEAHTDTPLAVMMLACPALRVVPLTIHKSLLQAIDHVAPHRIIATVRVMASSPGRAGLWEMRKSVVLCLRWRLCVMKAWTWTDHLLLMGYFMSRRDDNMMPLYACIMIRLLFL